MPLPSASINGAELWIALLGVVVACLSLGCQAATYVLTGGRVKVILRVGALADSGQGMVTAPPSSLSREWAADLAAQGYSRPVVAVRVANVGRLPVTVERWSIRSPRGVSVSPIGDSIGPTLPHRLDAGESATWAVDAREVQALAQAAKVLPDARRGRGLFAAGQVDDGLRGVVELGDGRSRRSRETIG